MRHKSSWLGQQYPISSDNHHPERTVGLFDTPYPYLAENVLELAAELRRTSPIIAMTERDPREWANSRTKNHGILVCRKEYSFERLGASEFDVIGCVGRAYNISSVSKGKEGPSSSDLQLHFWDVFQYRSRNEDIDPTFQSRMELQMEIHQAMYLPIAQYTPDFFGVQSSAATKAPKIKEKDDVASDIRKHILLSQQTDSSDGSNGVEKIQSTLWQDRYTKPLTCRGRVNWEMKNDTFLEYYHLPKTCEVSSEERRNNTIPLISSST